jgi:Abnormal spindle-like microcephaly-assoc'd, ASPM-SPD-2-Hydin
VSDIYAIFLLSGLGVSVPAVLLKDASSKRNGYPVRSGVKTLWLGGLGKALLFALACCLTIVVSGCGSGAIDPNAGGGVFVSPGSVNFGNVPVGQEVDSSVQVTNGGSSSVAVSQVNVSGQTFALVGGANMPMSIPAGGSYTLKFGFTPSAAANYSGQATLMGRRGRWWRKSPCRGRGHLRLLRN